MIFQFSFWGNDSAQTSTLNRHAQPTETGGRTQGRRCRGDHSACTSAARKAGETAAASATVLVGAGGGAPREGANRRPDGRLGARRAKSAKQTRQLDRLLIRLRQTQHGADRPRQELRASHPLFGDERKERNDSPRTGTICLLESISARDTLIKLSKIRRMKIIPIEYQCISLVCTCRRR